MPRILFLLLFLTSIIVLQTACSTLPADSSDTTERQESPPVSGKSHQWLDERLQQLQGIRSWSLSARFSLVTDDEAWSGKLDWVQQSNQEYLIHFSDPTGQGAMQLLGNGQWVELRLANGDSYQAKDADTLLKKETDWQLPINSLWYWVRALPDPKMSLRSELNSQALPIKFEQDDWSVIYHSYHHIDQYAFPRKIIVEKDALKLKLIIMNWVIE